MGKTYKWKIAFHYQNKNNISIVPVFTQEALKLFLEKTNDYKEKMNMADMYGVIKSNNDISTLEKAFELAVKIWNEYSGINITEGKKAIKYNHGMSDNRKTNATSNLECIEYEVKAHRVKYTNEHNKLEESFELFLNNIYAESIKKDEQYIDFQFCLKNKKFICELKPTYNQKDIKYAIRGAVGQVLGYSYNKNFDFKIIVFQKAPDAENMIFLEYLKDNHNIFYLYEIKKGKGVFDGNIKLIPQNK